MLSDQAISVTDLRTKTASILKWLSWVKFILANNKPKAVLLDMHEYEEYIRVKKIQEIKEEVIEAQKTSKRHSSVEGFMDELLTD